MVTPEDIRKIAALAKLYIDESEIDKLTEDMSSIIAFADQVSEAEVTAEEENSMSEGGELRSDEVRASFPVEEILSNASISEDGYFAVRGKVNE